MADKAEKKAEAPKDAGEKKEGEAKKGGGLLSKTPVLLGIVMMLEAVVLFAGFKFLGGGPKTVVAVDLSHGDEKKDDHGGGGHGDDKGDGHGGGGKSSEKKKVAELQVVEFKAPNTQNGRRFIYDVSIFVSVKGDAEEKAKTALKEREAMIKDRIRTIIAQIDPEKLGGGSEPGLETLRRQVKYQLDEIIGPEMIDEVLVPRCIPFRADF